MTWQPSCTHKFPRLPLRAAKAEPKKTAISFPRWICWLLVCLPCVIQNNWFPLLSLSLNAFIGVFEELRDFSSTDATIPEIADNQGQRFVWPFKQQPTSICFVFLDLFCEVFLHFYLDSVVLLFLFVPYGAVLAILLPLYPTVIFIVGIFSIIFIQNFLQHIISLNFIKPNLIVPEDML